MFEKDFLDSFIEGVEKKCRRREEKQLRTKKRIITLCVALVITVTAVGIGYKPDQAPHVAEESSEEAEESEPPVVVTPGTSTDVTESDTSHSGLNGNLLTEVNNFHYGTGSPFGENFWEEPDSYKGLTLILKDGVEIYLEERRHKMTQFDCEIDFSDAPAEKYQVIISHHYTPSGPVGCEDISYGTGLNEANALYITSGEFAQELYSDSRHDYSADNASIYSSEIIYHRRLFDIEQYCLQYWNDEEHKEAYEELTANGISEDWVEKYGITAWQRNGGYCDFLFDLTVEELQNSTYYTNTHSFKLYAPEVAGYYYFLDQEETLKKIGKTDYLKNYLTEDEFYDTYTRKELEVMYGKKTDSGYALRQDVYSYYEEEYEKEHGYSILDFQLERNMALMEYYSDNLAETYNALGIPFEYCEADYYYEDRTLPTDKYPDIVEGYWIEVKATLTKDEIKKLKTIYGSIHVTLAPEQDI